MSTLNVTTVDCDSHPWEYLTTGTVSSAVANFDVDVSSYAATHDRLRFEVENLTVTTDGTTIELRVSVNSGSSFISTSDHEAARYGVKSDGAATGAYGTSETDDAVLLGGTIGNAAAEFATFDVTFLNPFDTTYIKLVMHEYAGIDEGASLNTFNGGGSFNTTSAIDQVRFIPGAGNVDNAVWRLFGRKVL